jgi:carboxypeptidase C (cathepsin A)
MGLDPSQFRVTGLEDIEPSFKEFDGDMYAGFLPIDDIVDAKNKHDESRGEISFWLFAPSEEKDSLTIWLNGGPGCSSFHAGLVMECSPVTTPHHPAGHGKA